MKHIRLGSLKEQESVGEKQTRSPLVTSARESIHSAISDHSELNRKYTATLLATSEAHSQLHAAYERIAELEAELARVEHEEREEPVIDIRSAIEAETAPLRTKILELTRKDQSYAEARSITQESEQTASHRIAELESKCEELQFRLHEREKEFATLQSSLPVRLVRRAKKELHKRPFLAKIARKARRFL